MMKQARAAFTLMEMAIVLAIIGLITGGIMLGQNIIRNAETSSVLADASTYATAMQHFQDQYGQLPGDLSTATRIWGSETADGNGSGMIDSGEIWRAWQQLALAGFIKGRYTGVVGPGGNNHAVPSVNAPGSALDGTSFFIYSWATVVGNSSLFDGNYANVIIFGGISPNDWPYNAVLTPAEVYRMDVKTDDSYPGTGGITTYKYAARPNCVTTNDPTTARYKRSFDADACILFFMQTFKRPNAQ